MRLVSLALTLLVSACRLHFDAPTDSATGLDDGAASDDSVPPTQSQVVTVGHGAALVAGQTPCARAEPCVYTTPITVTPVAGEGWELESFSAPCAGQTATCSVPLGAQLTVTFRQAPITANVLFVTSTPAPLTGLANIDAHCASLATAAGLPGTFVAFASTSTLNARDRVAGARGWVGVDNLPVIDTISDLQVMSRNRGVTRDESGVAHRQFVLTGSDGGGVKVTNTCGDWTTTTGAASGGTASWTGAYTLGFGGSSCGVLSMFYCIQTDRSTAVTLQPAAFPVGRYIFLSAQPFAPVGGIAAADLQCTNEATAANLPGAYRALLATTTESAADHIGGLGGIWRRSDGVVVTFDRLDAPALDAVITRDASGVSHYDYNVFLGAYALDAATTGADSCADWTAASGSPAVVGVLSTQILAGSAPDCTTTPNRLFCAQIPN